MSVTVKQEVKRPEETFAGENNSGKLQSAQGSTEECDCETWWGQKKSRGDHCLMLTKYHSEVRYGRTDFKFLQKEEVSLFFLMKRKTQVIWMKLMTDVAYTAIEILT